MRAATKFSPTSKHASKLNVAIIGAGQIGSILARSIIRQSEQDGDYPIRLVSLCSRSPKKFLQMEDVDFTDDYQDILSADNIDVVVETVGGVGTAYDVVRGALDAGKSVVTNNSALMSAYGENLMRLSEAKNGQLRCEGAILSGIPTLNSILNYYSDQKIERVYGVLNATCNYALMRMRESGDSLSDALQVATELGYADRDSSLDVSGIDTLMRIGILSGFAFSQWPNMRRARPEGIEQIQPIDTALALKLGYRVKLLGIATIDGIEVSPHLVDEMSMMGRVHGSMSGLVVETRETGANFFASDCVGKAAALQALQSDLGALSRGESGFKPRKVKKTQILQKHAGLEQSRLEQSRLDRFFIRLPKSFVGDIGKSIRVLEEYYDERSGFSGLIVETGIPKNELSALFETDDILVLNIFDR